MGRGRANSTDWVEERISDAVGQHSGGMNALQHTIRSLGQLAATHELYARGHGKKRLRRAVHAGEIIRVRKGWYACPELSFELQQAARVGGRLASVSAAREYGIWVPGQPGSLHVEVAPGACQLRSRNNYRRRLSSVVNQAVDVHWQVPDGSASRVIVGATECIRQILRDQPPEFGFVVAESALNLGIISIEQWHGIRGSLPPRLSSGLRAVCSLSESGTESMFSFRMCRLGICFRQQVQIGPDRVDFVLGERLVVEIDSLAHHDPIADRRRDARLSIRGYRVLRFYYEHVVNEWWLVEASVLAAISRGDHLR